MSTIYNTWNQNGIEIDEVEHDHDAHAFEIYADDRHVVTIYAGSLKDTEDIRAGLDDGDDIRDWEDGDGRCIGTLIAEAE